MTIYLSLLVAVIGAVVYLAATNPKVAELGRACFSVGLLAFLLRFAGDAVARLP